MGCRFWLLSEERRDPGFPARLRGYLLMRHPPPRFAKNPTVLRVVTEDRQATPALSASDNSPIEHHFRDLERKRLGNDPRNLSRVFEPADEPQLRIYPRSLSSIRGSSLNSVAARILVMPLHRRRLTRRSALLRWNVSQKLFGGEARE